MFAAGTVAAVEVFQRAQAGASDGENTFIATYLAHRRLEELRNVAYASLTSETRADVSSPSGFTHFEREVTVTTPYTNLRQLVVNVYWTTAGGDASVSVQTYRSGV